MKKILILVLCLLQVNIIFSQNHLTENQKLASLCKIWGFLKYYHPKVAKGKMDWDQALIDKIPVVEAATNKKDLSRIYVDWIKGLGKVRHCRNCKNEIPDSLKYNLDLHWMDDKSMIEDSLRTMLYFVRDNRNQAKNYYVQQRRFVGNTIYSHEKPYKGYDYPPADYRLLCL